MFEFAQIVGHIDGWLTRAEGLFLYSAASHVPIGLTIVEVGSWMGRSTLCLANGSQDGFQAKVYAIDPHTGSGEHRRLYGPTDTFATFLSNIESSGVGSLVEPVRTESSRATELVPGTVGLLFLDGAHNYRAIKADLKLWLPKVAPGGCVAVHDSWQIPGPSIATAQLLLFSSKVRRARIVDTITVFETTSRATAAERAHNASVLLYRCVAGFFGWMRLRNSRARLARLGLSRP